MAIWAVEGSMIKWRGSSNPRYLLFMLTVCVYCLGIVFLGSLMNGIILEL
jgi:hypothetical protein